MPLAVDFVSDHNRFAHDAFDRLADEWVEELLCYALGLILAILVAAGAYERSADCARVEIDRLIPESS